MSRKVGRNAKITLGTVTVAHMGTWTLSGFSVDILDVMEFGQSYKDFELGLGDYGECTATGYYDPADSTGQILIESACKNMSKVTDLRLYVDNTSYIAPDITNDSDSGFLITKFGPITMNSNGIGTVEFTAKVTGKLTIV